MAFFGLRLIPDREAGEYFNPDKDYSAIPAWKGSFTLGVLVLTVLAMVLEDVIKVPLYISACAGSASLVVAGVISEKEANASFEMVVVFLLAFMLPMATALSISGASTIITDKVLEITGQRTLRAHGGPVAADLHPDPVHVQYGYLCRIMPHRRNYCRTDWRGPTSCGSGDFYREFQLWTVAFPELGPEAVRMFELERMPLTVFYDSVGGSLFFEPDLKKAGLG